MLIVVMKQKSGIVFPLGALEERPLMLSGPFVVGACHIWHVRDLSVPTRGLSGNDYAPRQIYSRKSPPRAVSHPGTVHLRHEGFVLCQ